MEDEEDMILEKVEDINKKWVERLISKHLHARGDTRPWFLLSWSIKGCPSVDPLAGISSSRASVRAVYRLQEGEEEEEMRVVVKVTPTKGLMANLMISLGMHRVEAGQYGGFLRAVAAWEVVRRGGRQRGVVEQLVPRHNLALASARHLTLVLPELTHLGYRLNTVAEGLGEAQVLEVAAKVGSLHGTVLAYKRVTNTHLPTAFPDCFPRLSVSSPGISMFTKLGFQRIRDEWSRDENLAPLLQKLDSYEAVAPAFVVNSLEPIEPFATMIHADLQPSNLFFRSSPDGGTELKIIDWATARYSQGTFDLVYLLNVCLEAGVRRRAEARAKDAYFRAFNAALTDLGGGLTLPRLTFEKHYLLGRQLIVIWSIMTINIFSSKSLRQRLLDILTDVLFDPKVGPLRL